MSAKKVLIVEDDKALTFIYQQLLQIKGISSFIAHDGEQALSYIREEQPEIVLLDLHVPYLSGTDIIKHVQENKTEKDIGVILASADTALCNVWRDSVYRVFIKPFDLEKLVDSIVSYSQVRELC